MKHLDLFSGIGGFALAARWMGWQTIGFVEIDSFCQKLLKKRFDGVQVESDIREVTGSTFRERPDIITGGFPCQPFSVAGKRRGTADDRHLWPEMVRVIKEYKPRWVVGENVAGIIPMELDSVLLDLEAAGYEAWPVVIPACGVDAKHRRMRVWIVAHSYGARQLQSCGRIAQQRKRPSDSREVVADSERMRRGESTSAIGAEGESLCAAEWAEGTPGIRPSCETLAYASGERLSLAARTGVGIFSGEAGTSARCEPGRGDAETRREWTPESAVCRVVDGISRKLDGHHSDRLRSLGNAIVPQVAYEVFRAIGYQR